jgi:hypothetical protein
LVIPASPIAKYRAAFAVIGAETGMGRSPRAALDAFGIA